MQQNSHTNGNILIFCSDLFAQHGRGSYQLFSNTKALWQVCREDDIKTARMSGCMDPVLKLWHGWNVMFPEQMDCKCYDG
jgi:hypothetical protein